MSEESVEYVIEEPRPPKRVAIRVVRSDGKTALAEWPNGDDAQRAWFPAGKVKPEMTEAELKRGQPYGEDWTAILPYGLGAALSPLLHRRGIWTMEQLALQRAAVMRLIWKALGMDDLIRANKE